MAGGSLTLALESGTYPITPAYAEAIRQRELRISPRGEAFPTRPVSWSMATATSAWPRWRRAGSMH
ncbi:hypothetical protein NWF32_27180 [Pseudomonas qingdaonensis]|nr:hypothetical protein [Pseudomonas qingdaonensis]